MENQEPRSINIDGVEHDIDTFDETQKYLLAQVQDLVKKGGTLKFQIDQIEVARQFFIEKLVDTLKPEKVPEVIDA